MPADEVTGLSFTKCLAQTVTTAEQRGYDRAIAEVVAWLRKEAERKSGYYEASSEDTLNMACDAIEAGEHKP